MIALGFSYLVKQIKESIMVKYFDNITDLVNNSDHPQNPTQSLVLT